MYKNRLSWIVLIFLLTQGIALPLSVHAQIVQAERYEIEQRPSDEDFIIIPLKEDGLALFRRQFKFNDRKRIWELILLDSTATFKTKIELEVDNQGELTGYEHSHGFVHLLFTKNEFRGEMIIFSVDLSSFEYHPIKVTTELKLNLTHFTKCGDNFIFGGDVGEEPAIFIYTPSTKNFITVPGFFKKRTELIDVQVNDNQTFNTLLISRENPDNTKIIFRTFDPLGRQLIEDIIPTRDHTLKTGMSTRLKRDDLMILGTWGDNNSSRAFGFYGVPVNPFSEQEIKFTFLGELQHYLDHTKPRRVAKIKAKTKRALEEGGNPDFSNYIALHRIMEHERGFVLLAETYIPIKESYSPGYTPYTYGSVPYAYRYRPYYYPGSGMYNTNDGRYYRNDTNQEQEIRAVQSQVIVFNPNGEVTRDHSIDLKNTKVPALNQVTDFYLATDTLYFLYKDESDLIIKKINLWDDTIEESTQKVKTKNPGDIIRSESKDGRIRHWYGNSFYMYGYQTIRYAGGKSQDVFYVTRVYVE